MHDLCELVRASFKCVYVKKSSTSMVFLGIFVCSQSGNHLFEDLVKFGYKPKIKVQIFDHLSIFLLHNAIK